MFRILLATALVAISVCAKAQVEVGTMDLGLLTPGKVVEFEVALKNLGDQALILDEQSGPDWHDLRVVNLPIRIAADGMAIVKVRGSVATAVGQRTLAIQLASSEADIETVRIAARALVYSVFDPAQPQLDLGVITAGTSSSVDIEFSSREIGEFALLAPVDPKGLVFAEVLPSQRGIRVANQKTLSWGIHEGEIRIVTDSDVQPQLIAPFRFEIRGAVRPSRFEADLGWHRSGEHPVEVVFLEGREGADLKIGTPRLDGDPIELTQHACPQPSKNCIALHFAVSESTPKGRVQGRAEVPLQDYDQTLLINYGAVVLAPDTEIRDISFESLMENGDPAAGIDQVLGLITHSTTPIRSPEPEGTGPLLRWTVIQEGNVFGYVIYRSQEPDGPQSRVNLDPIKPLSVGASEAQPVEHAWRDNTADPEISYWYQIVAITKQGLRQDLSGRLPVAAKAIDAS